jgi:hypothetical protein
MAAYNAASASRTRADSQALAPPTVAGRRRDGARGAIGGGGR